MSKLARREAAFLEPRAGVFFLADERLWAFVLLFELRATLAFFGLSPAVCLDDWRCARASSRAVSTLGQRSRKAQSEQAGFKALQV